MIDEEVLSQIPQAGDSYFLGEMLAVRMLTAF